MRAMQNKLTLQTISLRQNGDMERIVRTLRTRSLRHNGDNEQIPPPDRIPSVERRASALSALGTSGQSARWPSLEVHMSWEGAKPAGIVGGSKAPPSSSEVVIARSIVIIAAKNMVSV